MNELITKSLAQIVNTNPRAAAVFEKYHLDFCCKGKRSLEYACSESNLQVDEVIADLENTSTGSCSVPVNFERFTLTQLTGYIVATHHAFVKKEMEPLLGYLEKIASKHGDRHPEMRKVLELFTALKEEMEPHMQKEELILFPRIIEIEKNLSEGKEVIIGSGYFHAPIIMMEQEHDNAGALMAEIRKFTDNYTPPPDACTTYRLSFAILESFELDLHQHVHLENNILFPKALQLLSSPRACSLN